MYVKDLPTAVEQYKKILGLEPAKVKADYAEEELLLRQGRRALAHAKKRGKER
jgi:hypothetical protein